MQHACSAATGQRAAGSVGQLLDSDAWRTPVCAVQAPGLQLVHEISTQARSLGLGSSIQGRRANLFTRTRPEPAAVVAKKKAWITSAKAVRGHRYQRRRLGGQGREARFTGGANGGGGGGKRRGSGLAVSTNSPMTNNNQQDAFGVEEESQIVTYGEQYNPATGWIR